MRIGSLFGFVGVMSLFVVGCGRPEPRTVVSSEGIHDHASNVGTFATMKHELMHVVERQGALAQIDDELAHSVVGTTTLTGYEIVLAPPPAPVVEEPIMQTWGAPAEGAPEAAPEEPQPISLTPTP